jgi:phenylalanyl-tRNA synthetase alpha chain
MALQDFLDQLDELGAAAESAFGEAADTEALEAARVTFLGAKKGRLKSIQQQMGSIEREDKPTAGKAFNATKGRIEAAFEAAQQRSNKTDSDSAASIQFDASLPGATFRCGNVHPITQTIEELKDIMGRLGFSIVDGPEIEDDWHNFVALNIPDDHPARDPLENFYLATADTISGDKDPVGLLLRSQTSTVQIRVMEKTAPPIRIISLGRVYRPDTADATHYPMFHQIEGLMIDTDVSMADLKSVLRLFATSYLGDDVTIRFRPSFFPFTEPSVEADYYWNGQWVEFGGAGMVDPNVLKAVGYDPEEVTGFAFGLGVERLCMRRHGVTDIREFYKNDVRFLAQF